MNKLNSFVLMTLFLWIQSSNSNGDLVWLSIGSNDTVDLDFDGAGTETHDTLGVSTKTFVLTGGDIPTEFSGIDSLTIEFLATGGDLSAHHGLASGGIGVASNGEGALGRRALSNSVEEILAVNVTSTSTNPNLQIRLGGEVFSSWRTEFPVSQVEFTGATVNGQNFHTGELGDGTAVFDLLSSGVTVKSTGIHASGGGDPLRLHSIGLQMQTVPEPGTGFLTGLLLCGLVLRRKKPPC